MASAPAVHQIKTPRRDVLSAVFPVARFTTPTPESTPLIGTLASPGQSFGGLGSAPNNVSEQAVQLNRAWSVVTRCLKLPLSPSGKPATISADTLHALSILLDSSSPVRTELLEWYLHEIGVHFRSFVLPKLEAWQRPVPTDHASALVRGTVDEFTEAKRFYLESFYASNVKLHRKTNTSLVRNFIEDVNRAFKKLILHSLPIQRVQKTLAFVMFESMSDSLAGNISFEKCSETGQCHCSMGKVGFPFDRLHTTGIGGPMGERAFAQAIDRFLSGPAIERRCFEVDWNGHQLVVEKLRTWIEQHFNPFARDVLRNITGNDGFELPWQDMKQLDVMAVTHLGHLRTASLFDYVKTWPDSTGAILDIRSYMSVLDQIGVGGHSEKAFVCQSFINQTQRRLLHAGASTSEILSIYINVIHVFKTLDARGVLLGKVAIAIRNYLRARDDTASIVAASLLADPERPPNATEYDNDKDRVCTDIAHEVSNSTLQNKRDDRLLNWNDMEWMPDPIDAGPDYKSTKSDDVMAHLLRLFEQEDFIKEITTTLAQLLLYTTDLEYVRETRLIELLKSRLDATKLQAAEVMLQDVRESANLGKRINPVNTILPGFVSAPTPLEIQGAIPDDGITLGSLYNIFTTRMKRAEFLAVVKLVSNRRGDLLFPKRTRLPDNLAHQKKTEPQTIFRTQVLSSFFWPQLRSDEFVMPEALSSLQSTFDSKFRDLGNQRKLHFQPALSRVSLRLDLEDRTIDETDIPGWRASVIDAFAALPSDGEGLTTGNLVSGLQMEEELVLDALAFWSSKRVLFQPSPGMYAVLERLDMDTGASAQDVPDKPHKEISAMRSQDAVLREAAPMFQAFISNMLQNGGAKEVEGPMGITSVLRMVNPTFIYGDEEVRWLLAEMEARGEVKKNGEAWSVP